jgi:heat shock protein HslJ
MMCAEPEGIMQQESEYLTALQSATSYRIEGDRLYMQNAEGSRAVEYSVQTSAAGPSEETLANMEYKSEWTQSGTAPLTNGEYREQAAPGSATETVVRLTDQIAYGTLNGQEAAAVVLVTDPGGSGTFYDLAVVVEQDGQPVNVATTLLGDRAQVNSVTIENNQIVVDMITHGPEDPMCCPSQQVVQVYELQGDQLVQVSSQAASSGTDSGLDIVGVVWKWERFLESNDNTITVQDPDSYTLEFLPDGQVQAQADCNMTRGTYTLSGNQLTIVLGPTTMAVCPPGSLSDEYMRLLQEVNSYVMEGDNLALAIKYDSGIMVFAPGK